MKLKQRASRFSIYGGVSVPKLEESEEEDLSKYEVKQETKRNYVAEFVRNYFKGKDKLIFWVFLYTAVMILVFAERAYYYR